MINLKMISGIEKIDSGEIKIRMVFAVLREALVGAEYRILGDREEFMGDNLYTDAKEVINVENSSDSAT